MFVEGCEVEGEKGEMFLQVGSQGICLSSSEYFSVFKFMSVFFFFCTWEMLAIPSFETVVRDGKRGEKGGAESFRRKSETLRSRHTRHSLFTSRLPVFSLQEGLTTVFFFSWSVWATCI